MTQNYIQNAISIANHSAKEVIMSTTKGLKNKFLVSIATKMTKPLMCDMKEIRRSISEKLQEDGKYNFSI